MDFRLTTRRYSLKFRAPVRTAHGLWSSRDGLYVRIERPDGTAGYGEASPIPHFGTETADAEEAFCRSLGGGVDAGLLSRMPENLCALRNALSCALSPGNDAPCHKSLALAALLPAGRAALESAPPKADAGFRVFKWKVAVQPADDEMAILDDLIGVLPSGSRIRLDANGGWNRRTAGLWMAHAVGRPVEFVEQPIDRDTKGAEDTLMGLAADYPVPIALDESIAADADVRRWLEAGWSGFYVVKTALLGDVRGVLTNLAAARANVVFSSALETGMGAQAALRAAFAWTGTPHALGFGVWPIFADARFDGPYAAPFIRLEDVEQANPEALWNAAN